MNEIEVEEGLPEDPAKEETVVAETEEMVVEMEKMEKEKEIAKGKIRAGAYSSLKEWESSRFGSARSVEQQICGHAEQYARIAENNSRWLTCKKVL